MNITAKIRERLLALNPWHFLWITVLLSEIFTASLNSVQSYLRWGFLSYDLLVIGAVDAFFVSLVVASLIMAFVIQISSLREEISSQKKFGQDLKTSEAKFRIIAEMSKNMIFINKKGRVVYVNAKCEEIMGYTCDEFCAPDFDFCTLIAPEHRDMAGAVFAKQMQDENVPPFEYALLTKEGQRLEAIITTTVFQYEGETSVLGIITDITDRKRMERELKDYSEHLEQMVKKRTVELDEAKILAEAANRAKSEFLSNMSHELTTPLNSVIGFSQVLQDELYGRLNEKQREYVSDILGSGTQLLSLITDILDLSRIEAGKDELRISRFLLKEALGSAVALFNEDALKHDLSLSLEVAPDVDIEIEADPNKFNQIMFNLLSNAVKFTPPGGSVRIAARRVDAVGAGLALPERAQQAAPLQENRDFIEISVTDTGIGIRQEDLPGLFQQLRQIESPYTKRYSGAGVGLLLTKRLVELHDGRIWVESQFGKGSRVAFILPESYSEARKMQVNNERRV